MKSQEFKMPAFGVGPMYVFTCLILTIVALCLHFKGYLYQGELREGKIFFYYYWDYLNIIRHIFMGPSSHS